MTKAENEALYNEWKKGMITWWEFLDKTIKETDETDKKFLLYLLLIWYQRKLKRDIEDEAELAGVFDIIIDITEMLQKKGKNYGRKDDERF